MPSGRSSGKPELLHHLSYFLWVTLRILSISDDAYGLTRILDGLAG